MLVLTLFIGSCSNSDNDQTFLEKHHGTVWEFTASEIVQYLRIIDNVNTPFEFWSRYIDEECYYYDNEIISNDDIITKNSNNTFEFELSENEDGILYLEKVKITINGDDMIVVIEEYEDGILDEMETINFERSSENVDSFTLCID